MYGNMASPQQGLPTMYDFISSGKNARDYRAFIGELTRLRAAGDMGRYNEMLNGHGFEQFAMPVQAQQRMQMPPIQAKGYMTQRDMINGNRGGAVRGQERAAQVQERNQLRRGGSLEPGLPPIDYPHQQPATDFIPLQPSAIDFVPQQPAPPIDFVPQQPNPPIDFVPQQPAPLQQTPYQPQPLQPAPSQFPEGNWTPLHSTPMSKQLLPTMPAQTQQNRWG